MSKSSTIEPMASPALSPAQTNALFDILTHHEAYAEIEAWKFPDLARDASSRTSQAPLIRQLTHAFVLTLPGLRELSPNFWPERAGTLVANLSEAELSESYDKGNIGTRKTISTAHSVILEQLVRGLLGKCPKVPHEAGGKYDMSNAEDLERAWNECLHDIIYGDLIDELFEGFAESEDLEKKSLLVQAALKHVFLILASFAHHIFVLSPSGQDILKLLNNANKMIPYMALKQALRVGNAATMINGVLKLILTKLGIKAMTNWLGLSKSADDGVNLLQQIISTVLGWDQAEFKDTMTRITKAKNGPSKEHIDAIETHINSTSREQHEKLRALSVQQSKSIVQVIFENSRYVPTTTLTEAQHTQALEYYSARLSIRDRKEIIRVACRGYPDNLTQIIRDVVAVYEPLIRSVHEGVDLSTTVGYVQEFLTDLIKTVKPNSGNKAPSVQDFAALFQRHAARVFRVLHQVAGNCPEWALIWRQWCKKAALEFRKGGMHAASPNNAAGAMTEKLRAAFDSIPDQLKPGITTALTAHASYLAQLNKLSANRAQDILDNKTQAMHGPGVYLARWHGLIDSTLVTPATAEGKIRKGKDVQFKDDRKKKSGAKDEEWWDSEAISKQVMAGIPEEPNIDIVVKVLGDSFRGTLKDYIKL